VFGVVRRIRRVLEAAWGDTPPPRRFRVVFVSYSGSFAGLGGARGGVGGYATSMSFLGRIQLHSQDWEAWRRRVGYRPPCVAFGCIVETERGLQAAFVVKRHLVC